MDIPFEPPCRTDTVLTVERVERVYAEEAVYDMEASGFYEAALDGGHPGLVQVLKVVSDNKKSGVESVSGARVEQLLAARADTVEDLVSTVGRWAQQTAAAR